MGSFIHCWNWVLQTWSETAKVSVCPSSSAMNLRLCFDPIIYKVVYFIIIFKVFKYGAVLLRIEEDYNVTRSINNHRYIHHDHHIWKYPDSQIRSAFLYTKILCVLWAKGLGPQF